MNQIVWNKKNEESVLELRQVNQVPFFVFPALEQTGLVAHGFSTRLGGVSKGDCSTMNFSFTRGDHDQDVRTNYERMAQALSVEPQSMVLSYQTHTTNIRKVTGEDMGKGVYRDRDYKDIDGLITNEPGVTLVTFYADCVPLFLLDPVKKAIGLSHSGWRGTVARMGKATVEAMTAAYGSDPGDLIACIGPSICKDCYEIGPEVAEQFAAHFDSCYHNQILEERNDHKYQLDLWRANQLVFLEAGIPAQSIFVTNTCTHCNPDLLFSHRKHGEKRGNLSAFLSLKKF